VASLIGKEIGKYRITERLGRGGMAEVYLGVHTLLDRKVAVKVLHSHLLEGGDFVARFKREAKAVANLRHPNIVQVHDFDIQDELIFMVMEFIDGTNLHTRLVEVGNQGERLPIKLIGSIINDIAGALDYAHSKGMLHRDIKPSNILLDHDDKAYLTDFGIAKLLDDQKFTATGQLVGTPAYMSPEQGMGEDLSEESDIYSLGIVAFEMLAGQVPYDAKTPIGIVHKQINDPIPNLSDLVDGVPGTAQEVLNRALAKTPEGRYSSAEALVGALRVALQALESPEPITAEPAQDPPTLVDDGLDAPTVTMDAADMEQATVIMEGEKKKEEPAKKAPQEKKVKQKKEPKAKGEKKIPVWAFIAGGVALLAVVGVILNQVLDINLPGTSTGSSSTSIPGAIEVVFDIDHTDHGLAILDNVDDGNYQIVDVEKDQAYSTGNGQSFTAQDGNLAGDYFLYFDIEDTIMYRLREGSKISILVTFLDLGTDSFTIQYDAYSGGPYGDGRYKDTGVFTKTNSGEFTTAEFKLSDAFFANLSTGDFRIFDNQDGAEVIRSVRVVYFPSESAQESAEELNGEELFQQGEELFNQERYEEALDYINRAWDAGYETEFLHDLRAWCNFYTGNLEESIDGWSRAIERNPDNFEYWMERGWRKFELGDLPGAIEDIQQARELAPDVWVAQFSLGEIYYLSEQDQYKDESHEALDQAIALEPTNPESRRLRGELKLHRYGDPEAALEDLNLAIEYGDPNDPGLFELRGDAYRQMGELGLCIDDFNRAFDIDDQNPRYYWLQGDCLAANGDTEHARNRYVVFIDLAKDDPEYEEQVRRIQSWLNEN